MTHPIDIAIIVGCFVMTIVAGVLCHRQTAKSVRSYFIQALVKTGMSLIVGAIVFLHLTEN